MENTNDFKILVVDDEPNLLQIAERLLKKKNYSVYTADTGQGCLDAINANKPDLLLLDVMLPDITGTEICKIIKSNPELSSIYVFLISGFMIQSESISEGLELGADGYLIKPIKNRELLARIEAAIRIIRTEKALRESEEKFRNVFDFSVVGKSMTMMNGTLRTNKAFLDIIGYSQDELTNLKWQDITHPDDIKHDTKIVNSIISFEKTKARWEKRYIHKNGKIVWVDISTTLMRDSNNNPLYFITSIIDITDRKLAEIALRDEKDQIRTILDLVGDPIFVKDNDHRITLANRAFYDIFKLDESNVIGYTLMEAVPENERHHFLKVDRSVLDTGTPDIREEELTVGENKHYIITRKTRFTDESGKRFLVGSIHNITERRKAEEAVLTSQKLLKEITDNSLSLIYALDYQGRFLLINSALEALFGVTRETLLGKTREAIMPAEIAALHRANDLKVMNDQIPIVVEEENKQSDGIHTYLSMKYPLLDAQGNLIGIGGVSTDITARKQAEEDLRKHTERLRNLHLIDQAILHAIESPESVIQTAIQYIRGLLNCQRVSVGIIDLEKKKILVYTADVDGKSIVEKILADEVYGMIDTLRQSKMEIVEDMSMVASPSLVNLIQQADGVHSYINIALVSELEMYGVLNVGWDKSRNITSEEIEIVGEVANQITIAIEKARLLKETKIHALELEERVRVRTNQLLAANKELETFTYSVSHDLKAPLRGIDGYSKLLLDLYGKDLNEEARTFIATIRSSALQMNQLIDDLLEYSRLERSQMRHEKIKIKNLISSITSSYKNELDIGRYLLKIEVPDIELMADTKGLTIALRNLVENAIKFTRGKPGPTIEIGLEELATSWTIRVKDNGIGFDMKYHQRIFEIFQRLHRAEDFPGTGIGLAMVNKAMQRMNGRVWAESEPEIGSVFYLEIPKTN